MGMMVLFSPSKVSWIALVQKVQKPNPQEDFIGDCIMH
jgi:hypothetical protein